MKNICLPIFFLFLFSQGIAQTISGAIAEIHLDSSTQELISGLLPINSSMTYTEDHLGNSNAAGIGFLDFGEPDFSKMDTSDFSIAFWFKKTGSLFPARSIIEKKRAVVGDYEQYMIRYNGVFHGIDVGFKPDADSSSVVVAQNWVSDSAWIHVVVTFDRDDLMKLYIDGIWSDEDYIGHLKSFPANVDNANLLIGNGNMALDEIIIFNHALDSIEVMELYNGQLTSLEKNITNDLQKLVVSPNPNNGKFNIMLPLIPSSDVSIFIFNNLGQKVFEKKEVPPSKNIKIQIDGLSFGIYFILLKVDDIYFRGDTIIRNE